MIDHHGVGSDGRDSPASTEQLTKCEKGPGMPDCVEMGSRLRGAAGTRAPAGFWPQLWATTVRNLLLKKRDTRKTLAEVLVPLYSLGVLIFLKMLIPNPNFPEVNKPGRMLRVQYDVFRENQSVAVVSDWDNDNGTLAFLEGINELLLEYQQEPILWVRYNDTTDLNDAYHSGPSSFPIAIIFHSDPAAFGEPLKYTIRTNPSTIGTPSTRTLYTDQSNCREADFSDWSRGGQLIPLSELYSEMTCPVRQYYYSGFLALQTLIDFTKIKLETGAMLPPPRVDLRQLPQPQHTGDWLLIFRIIMPMYMVMTLSQFITYLLMFVVTEKEMKIKEGMRIMGMKDSVYWAAWFFIYGVFVTILSVVSTVLLFTLKVFQHSSYVLIFLLMLSFGFTIITIAFMFTPFFDKARTAGIVGSFAVNIMSVLYFIQVFVNNADSIALWVVSLISSSCYALAMDKAIVMDMAGVGVTWENLWSGPGVPFGGSLIMMLVDTLLYALIAYWLDAVMPSEYGIKQKPWFFLLPSFWRAGRRGRAPQLHANGDAAHDRDVEPVPRELQDKEAIRIVGLQKSFRHCRRPEVKAIDNIDLSIYEGQITAILGHNGAGKSTLFNILTGLTAPTSGTAYVYGLDVRDPNDMSEIRQMTGVCPQQDVLFELLSVREHLEFFAALKGIPSKHQNQEISKAMEEVNLTEQAGVFAKHLSGGQRRKLSIAIACIGDPKIIILDEPTAGVDPVSRRQTWRILQRAKRGRVLLLTTHFMDEADILGDRKAVISKGRVRCAGTSLFLKNKFGIGYHLTLVLDGVCREHQITRLVRGHVPRAEKARRHGRELSYILPHYAVHLFPPLFQAIEHEIREKTNRLGITSYGVSMTTLEEVFLSLEGENEEETEEVEGVSSVKLVRARALSRSLSLQSKTLSYQELNDKDNQKTTSLPNPPASHALHSTSHGVEHVKVTPEPSLAVDVLSETLKTRQSFSRTFCALVYIRTIRMIRDPYKLYVMIMLPVVCCVFGLYIKSRQYAYIPAQALKLDTNLYMNMTSVALFSEQNNRAELLDLRSTLEALGAYSVIGYDGNFSSLLKMDNFGAFNVRNSLVAYGDIMAYYNSTFTHGLPIIMNLLDNSIFRILMQTADQLERFHPSEVWAHPFQQTEQAEGINFSNVLCDIFMGMIFALVPVTLAVDIVYDREIKAKNQLRVNGLSISMYFLTYFVILVVIMIGTTIGVLLLVTLNDIPSLTNSSAITMLAFLLLLYAPSAILFNTCLSYVFDKMDSAQSIMPNVSSWVGVIPFVMVALLDTFKWGSDIAFWMHSIFSFLNVMYIPYAIIYYVDRVYVQCSLTGQCTAPPLASYFTAEVWVLIAAMLLHAPACFAVLLAADRLKAGGALCPKGGGAECEPQADAEAEAGAGEAGEDDDVRRERRRVAAILQNQAKAAPALLVHNLRKEFPVRGAGAGWCGGARGGGARGGGARGGRRAGLARLSLAVDGGEVFGLLGHNGAGKTTTLKIITAETLPTHGTVMVNGETITANRSSSLKALGYCPQHDALWKNVTIREHIECYAAIRGVSKADTPKIVDAYLSGLQIAEHANKNAEECSGGTRRKLSFALAMVGSPRVVLLDEPSTGMDPRSKRFLWDTILASFQGKKGAILTTHSMEEADALCSRVGIMVKGGLRCIGSTQHLKNLYGAGYTLEIKIGQPHQKTVLESESMSPSPLRSTENSPSLGEADEGNSRTASLCAEGAAEAEPEAEPVDATIRTPLVAGSPPRRRAHHRTESSGGAGAEACVAMVSQLFPAAVLEENFADRLAFSVPQSSVASLARCFQQIEEAKERLNIVEYSFSQTTLEQVFLKFAQTESHDSDQID